MKTFPTVTLSNGIKVMNFNSPHSFTFEDDSILGAVSDEIAIATQLGFEDEEIKNTFTGTIDVVKKFTMSNTCLEHLLDAAQFAWDNQVNIILAPLPVVMAFKQSQISIPTRLIQTLHQRLRTIYVVDRITKKISTTKFCV